MDENFADFSAFNNRSFDASSLQQPCIPSSALLSSSSISSNARQSNLSSIVTIPVTVIEKKIKSAFPLQDESEDRNEEVVAFKDHLRHNP
jgi:hypothetical protein